MEKIFQSDDYIPFVNFFEDLGAMGDKVVVPDGANGANGANGTHNGV